jgi:hypothetical protein
MTGACKSRQLWERFGRHRRAGSPEGQALASANVPPRRFGVVVAVGAFWWLNLTYAGQEFLPDRVPSVPKTRGRGEELYSEIWASRPPFGVGRCRTRRSEHRVAPRCEVRPVSHPTDRAAPGRREAQVRFVTREPAGVVAELLRVQRHRAGLSPTPQLRFRVHRCIRPAILPYARTIPRGVWCRGARQQRFIDEEPLTVRGSAAAAQWVQLVS